jgi:hypothetical protein
MYATPKPTDEINTLDTRFMMVSPIQLIVIGMLIAYASSVPKMDAAVVISLAFAIGLIHIFEA